jgi:GcrA cell cycle regulator
MSGYGGHERWPVGRCQWLKDLWLKMSPSQIGEVMGITRNAVIGKANRMHLPRKQQQPPKIRVKHTVRFLTSPPPPPPPAPAPMQQPPSLNLTIYDVGEGQCRYPHGDLLPFFFCGQPVKEFTSYCPFHHGLCNYPITPARRDLYPTFKPGAL